MIYSDFAIGQLENRLAELFNQKSTPKKYAAVMLEALEVIRQLKRLNRRLTPPSDEPLTIEELRKMDGKPVYDWMGYEWFVVSEVTDGEVIMTDGTVFDIDEDSPNNAALRFCRREPETAL